LYTEGSPTHHYAATRQRREEEGSAGLDGVELRGSRWVERGEEEKKKPGRIFPSLKKVIK
jgi:hypothetical protein